MTNPSAKTQVHSFNYIDMGFFESSDISAGSQFWRVEAHTVWNEILDFWRNEFASVVDTTWMAECRINRHKTHCMVDSHNHQHCGLENIFGNVIGFLVEVLRSCGQPPNLHPVPTLPRFA